jgi:hypothetical protein
MWSWVLAFWLLTGMFLLSRKQRIGWLVLSVSGIGWIIYGWLTHQGGIVFQSIILSIVQMRAYIKWGK